VNKSDCYGFKVPSNIKDPNKASFIPFKKVCQVGCPPGYNEDRDKDGLTCRTCGSDCLKRCQSKIIDSIAAAQSLKGCGVIEGKLYKVIKVYTIFNNFYFTFDIYHIKGPLEIQIRSSSKTFSSSNVITSNNVVKELENSLSDIVEIEDYLKIARSFPIVSLSFLKNLKRIKGNRLESSKYSLIIWDNQNLEELWNENQDVKIEKGKLFFYFNPKLCFNKVEKLAKNNSLIENYETASKSNGDKITCNVTTLSVNVSRVLAEAALLSWQPLQLGDERSLLSYVVFYLPAPYQNVTLWEGRDACGNDG
jgi:insulin receptor